MPDEAQIEILLVDDDEGHSELVRRNLRRIGLTNAITSIPRGEEALDYVFCRNAWRDRADHGRLLILLDIKMPGSVDGIEMLRQVKADPEKRKIPVIMLTTTDDPREVSRCYDLGCSVYVTKPVEPMKFIESVRRLGLFLAVVSLPTERAPQE